MTKFLELKAEHLQLAYDQHQVVADLSVQVPSGQVTAIVGANACGKSTLLRGLARILKPKGGAVYLDGHDIHRMPTKQVAKQLGLLPQTPTSPEGITVADLVARGRYPHQSLFRQWTRADEQAVASAMSATEVLDLASRPVDELSGARDSGYGSRWRSLRTRPSCCSTNPRHGSTWRTRWRSSTS